MLFRSMAGAASAMSAAMRLTWVVVNCTGPPLSFASSALRAVKANPTKHVGIRTTRSTRIYRVAVGAGSSRQRCQRLA